MVDIATKIANLTDPQEFTRLCHLVFTTKFGDDYQEFDDDQSDGGNDGEIVSKKWLISRHCFKRLAKQKEEDAILIKVKSDLAKAVKLREGGMDIGEWIFVSAYRMPAKVWSKVKELAVNSGFKCRNLGPSYLASIIIANPDLMKQISWLRVDQIDERLETLITLRQEDKIIPSTSESDEINLTPTSKISLDNGQTSNALVKASDSSVLSELDGEYHDEINYARDLINQGKSLAALEYLEDKRKKIWNKASSKVKFRLLANIGASYLGIGKEEEAAKYFIEAYQYENSEKSFSNLALGYLLLKDYPSAIKAARQTLKLNPVNEGAYSVLIQALGEEESLSSILKKIPKTVHSLPQVMGAFGEVALHQDNYEEAIKWTKLSLPKDKIQGIEYIEVRLQFASLLLNSILKGKTLAECELPLKEREGRAHEALSTLEGVWKDLKDTQLIGLKIQCLTNKNLANRIVGNEDEALKDIERVLDIDPDNTTLLLQKASLLFDKKDTASAKELLLPLLDKEESAPLLYAEVLRSENKLPDVVNVLKSQISKTLSSKLLEREYKRYLIDVYLQMNEVDQAKAIADTLDVSLPINLVSQASVFRLMGEKATALEKLNQASLLVGDGTSSLVILALAYEYYRQADYKNAAKFYERVADITVDDFVTRKLLRCYYNTENDEKALEVLQSLRRKNGLIKDLTEFESSIYEDIGDLENARKLCEEHLAEFPNDDLIKVRLLMILFRQEKNSDLVAMLTAGIDDAKLPLTKRIQLAQAYSFTNQSFMALKVMYEARRKFYSESEAHARYISLFFSREKSLDFSTPAVAVDTAVCVESIGGKKEWYTIEDRVDSDVRLGEININHSLAKELLGKRVGDEVSLRSSDIQIERGKIVEIKSKFVAALHNSTESFNTMFPEDHSFIALKLDFSDDKPIPDSFMKMLDKDRDRHDKVVEIYNTGKVGLAMLSSMLGRNMVDTWGYAIKNKDIGIRSSTGNIAERKMANELLRNNDVPLALDLTAILTLHGLDSATLVSEQYGKLLIPQSTVDHLKEVVSYREGIESEGFTTLAHEDGEYVRTEVSQEMIKNNLTYLKSILRWLYDKCTILPCTEALSLESSKKSLLYKALGKPSSETVLLAKQEKALLYADDSWLRSLAKNEFGVEGVWTQAVLEKLVANNTLSKVDYEKKILKLLLSNYSFLPVSGDTLIEASKQAGWRLEPPLTDVISKITPSSSDIRSLLPVVEDFAILLFTRTIYLPIFEPIFRAVLLAAIPQFNKEVYLKALLIRLKKRLAMRPNIYLEIERIVTS